MLYTTEITEKLIQDYQKGIPVEDLALELEVPVKSVIAKLSSLGVYKRKEYLTKRGEPPIKKEVYIDRIADMLGIQVELLESLEKTTKSALVLLEKQIKQLVQKSD